MMGDVFLIYTQDKMEECEEKGMSKKMCERLVDEYWEKNSSMSSSLLEVDGGDDGELVCATLMQAETVPQGAPFSGFFQLDDLDHGQERPKKKRPKDHAVVFARSRRFYGVLNSCPI